MTDVLVALTTIAFTIGLPIYAFVQLRDQFRAHSEGMASKYDNRCHYCKKRLKYDNGDLSVVLFGGSEVRASHCRACGREQPIYTG